LKAELEIPVIGLRSSGSEEEYKKMHSIKINEGLLEDVGQFPTKLLQKVLYNLLIRMKFIHFITSDIFLSY